MSDDRIMQILTTVAILLFVSVGALSFGRSRYPWVKWARWGSVVIFSIAILYAVARVLLWAVGANY